MQSNIIGSKIKELRLRKNITQQDLSNDLSVASSTISNWEKGRRLPSISDLKRIAAYFGVSLGYFELEVESYNENTISHTSHPSQIIDMRPMGYATRKIDWIFFLIGLFLVTTGTILSNPDFMFFYCPIPDILIYSLYVFGLFFFLFVLFSVQGKQLSLKKNNYKRVLLQSSYKVYYAHSNGNKTSKTIKRYIDRLSLILVVAAILFFVGVVFLLSNTELPVIQTLIALYALFAIVTSLIRHRAIKSSMIAEEKADYYEVRANMGYVSIYLALIVDMFGLLLTYGIMILLADRIMYGFASSLLFAVAIIYLILSYKVYCDFNCLIADCRLYASDDHNNVIRIQ